MRMVRQLFLRPSARGSLATNVGAEDLAQLGPAGYSHTAQAWFQALDCLFTIVNTSFAGAHLDEVRPTVAPAGSPNDTAGL